MRADDAPYTHTVVKVIHDVFVQRDRNHGGLRGTMVRAAPDVASESDARAWVARDQRLERLRNTERDHDPAMPRAL